MRVREGDRQKERERGSEIETEGMSVDFKNKQKILFCLCQNDLKVFKVEMKTNPLQNI